jgi:hypothetical protein
MSANISLKEKLLAKCIEIKVESESSIIAAMEDAQQSANEYGPPKDRYDSFRAQLMRKRDMLGQQLAVVQEELRHLRQFKVTSVSKIVEPGALVVLDSQMIYILAGIGKVEIDKNTVYVVSPVVPLAIAMKGLKPGDTFSFRGNTMRILEIF